MSDIYTDEWGVFISGYAPFYDKNGKFVGTLGMDLEFNNFYHRLLPIKTAFEKTAIIILFIGLIIGLLIWYIRKHTQTLLLSREQNEIQKETTKSILENVYKENLVILKKVKNSILDLKVINDTFHKKFNSWITHIIYYQESKVAAKKNASVSFKTDDFISEIKRHKIILNIKKDNNVPIIVYGFPIPCYIELIDELISIVGNILETNELDLTISQTYEGINDIKLELQLSGNNIAGFEEIFLELSHPEVNLFDRSLQHKEFRLTTVIAQLTKYQSMVSCFSNKTHCGCSITISLLKPPE